MAKDYVERRPDSFYLAGTRVPLARIVWEFRNGESAETIRAHFPVLTLEEVYGSITFYLANKTKLRKTSVTGSKRKTSTARITLAPLT